MQTLLQTCFVFQDMEGESEEEEESTKDTAAKPAPPPPPPPPPTEAPPLPPTPDQVIVRKDYNPKGNNKNLSLSTKCCLKGISNADTLC